MAHIIALVVLFVIKLCESQDGETLNFSMVEESPPNMFIGDVVAAANLVGLYGTDVVQRLEFGFFTQAYQDASYFSIDNRGVLRTSAKKLDREEVCSNNRGSNLCFVEIDVGINRPVAYLKVFTIKIQVADINDNAPIFPQPKIAIQFSEAAPIGSTISLPIALDKDSVTFSVKRYTITNTGVDKFELITTNLDDVKLRLKSALDREVVSSYSLTIVAYDGGSPSLSGSVVIDIEVEDANDHAPEFTSTSYLVNVREDFAVNGVLCTVKAQDLDNGPFGEVRYRFTQFTESMYDSVFAIDATTGDIILKQSLDYESRQQYSLDIVAEDGGGVDAKVSKANVLISVDDINDNAPQITVNTLGADEIVISEDAALKTFVAHISVFDPDRFENGTITCQLSSSVFELESKSNNRFNLVTAALLDREIKDRYEISVECFDRGNPPLSSRKDLVISVKDENDHAPFFPKLMYNAAVLENNDIGAAVIQVNASDRDLNENARVTYELSSSDIVSKLISIDPQSGTIIASSKFDYEEVSEIKFDVIAKDAGNPVLSSTAKVTITILDQNDEAPIFKENSYEFNVEENQPYNTIVGRVQAVDADMPPFNRFAYILQDSRDALNFQLDPSSGIIKTMGQLDRETAGSYQLVVRATDANDPTLSSSVPVHIRVTDVNDNYPRIHYPTNENDTVHISNNAPVGYTILKVQATDGDSGHNANLSYILTHNTDASFVIDPHSGVIKTNMDFSSVSYKEYVIKVVVRDHGSPEKAASSDVRIVVDDAIAYDLPNQQGIVKQNNLTIIIAVATVSGVVMVILLIAIILLKTGEQRRKRFDERDDKYENAENGRKEVSFAIERDEQNRQVVPMSYEVGVKVDSVEAAAVQPRHPNSQLESHLLSLSKSHAPRDVAADNASDSSADVSTADSGRGPSEEGGDARQPAAGGHSARHPPPAGHSSPRRHHNNPPPPPRVPPRCGLPPRRSNSHRDTAPPPPPSYSTFLRTSGSERRVAREPERPPKLPCKMHGHLAKNGAATRHSAGGYGFNVTGGGRHNINFGDLPRDMYYAKNRSHDESLSEGTTAAHQSANSEHLNVVSGNSGVYNEKAVIV